MSLKQDKTISVLQELAGEFVNRESSRESLITITRVDVSRDIRRSAIYFTVLPEDQEERASVFLKRKQGEFREFVKKKSDLRRVPYFEFKLDLGEKSRQRLDELSEDR
jgi:ribosome-binding factor A